MEKINYNKIEMKFIEMKFSRDEIPCFWWRNAFGKRFLLKSIQVSGVYIMGNGVLLGPLP